MRLAKLRFVGGVLARMLILVGCIVGGALAANLVGSTLWSGPAASLDQTFRRVEREWLIGGPIGAAIGGAWAFRMQRRRLAGGARLGRTALAAGLVLVLCLGILME